MVHQCINILCGALLDCNMFRRVGLGSDYTEGDPMVDKRRGR